MFSAESYQEPFWAKSGNFVRGRDPLGIQNSSISVYASLLPGMTNLTQRLRYYGFYLWLLNEYKELPGDSVHKESVTDQYNFIRRGELIISYLMSNLHSQELAVIGSNFSSSHLKDADELGYYDVALGADKVTEMKAGLDASIAAKITPTSVTKTIGS